MSAYMTLEKYAATLKVGDEVTIEYHSMAGDRQTIEKILKITKSGTIYLRSTNCAELLAIAETIPAWPGFFDGIRSGYQSAADRLDTMPVVEERKHGHWIELEPDKYGNFIQCSVCDSKFGLYSKDNYCQACGAIMENNGDDDDE